jgi:hypothetical protein
MVKESCMKIRNSRLWRSGSARGDTKGENSIRIELEESDPALKITNAEITLRRQICKTNLRKLLRLKHTKNHEGKS